MRSEETQKRVYLKVRPTEDCAHFTQEPVKNKE